MHKPTEEMLTIFNKAAKNESFIVEAKAGAGKTTTISQVIKNEVINKKVLYLCFNTHNIEDAKVKLKDVDNVKITNVHKMAYAAVGSLYRNKLGDMSFAKYSYLLKSKDFNFTKSVRESINEYFCSVDSLFNEQHVKSTKDEHEILRILKSCKSLIKRMLDPKDLDVKLPHDGYLHLFCTGQMGLDVLKQYDLVVVDESQDQNQPFVALEKAYLHNGGQLIKVGDEHQSLYRFRLAVNANSQYKGQLPFLTLSKSFRFSNAIAELALDILAIKGTFNERFVANETKKTDILPPYTRVQEPRVVLHRTAAGVVRTAIELLSRNIAFNVVGGLRAYITNELYWFEALRNNDSAALKNIPRYFKKTFPTWQKVEEIAREGLDADVSRVVRIFTICDEKGFQSIEDLLQAVDNSSFNDLASQITITTVHRYKGSEHSCVVLSNDYKSLKDLKKLNRGDLEDEINNLYVAVTRAKSKLVLNDLVQEIINESKIRSRYA